MIYNTKSIIFRLIELSNIFNYGKLYNKILSKLLCILDQKKEIRLSLKGERFKKMNFSNKISKRISKKLNFRIQFFYFRLSRA